MQKDSDPIGQYKNITAKLKKRFLKKPNVNEGSEQFQTLARVLSNQECRPYSGFCFLAQARCEHSLSNPAGEANALLNAGREFMKEEKDLDELGFVSFEENLSAAINSYGHAIRVHMEADEYPMAAILSNELATNLARIGKHAEAVPNFERAAELREKSTDLRLMYLGHAASSRLELRDYVGALDQFTEMQQIIQENCYIDGKLQEEFIDVLARCEITRVLLLMLLKPTPAFLKQVHSKLLEKYTWEEADMWACSGAEIMNIDLFINLQSLVMCCQAKEIEMLVAMEPELMPMLSTEQQQLLHVVVREHVSPSGEGF